MGYFVALASAYLLVSASTALRPGRRGILKILAFPVGWAAGELVMQAIAVEGLLVAVLAIVGWPGGWLSAVVIALAAAVVGANLILVGVQLASPFVVARAMSSAPVAPLTIGRIRDDRFGSWWRTLLQIPFHSADIEVLRGIRYGPHPRHRLDVWRTSLTRPGAPVMVFVHGGAWIFGDKSEQGRPMLHELVSRGWIAVAMNYRLAPRYPWPAQAEDVTRALAWVKSTIDSLGGDPERVVISGASAGGHLCSLVALLGEDNPWRPEGPLKNVDLSVRGCVSLYGVLEMTGDAEIWGGHGDKLRELLEERVVMASVEGHESLYHQMSPIEHIGPSSPPFLVIQGSNDTLVDVEVARHFVARYRERATAPVYYVELPLTQHAFDVTASPRTSATTRAVAAFCEACVGPA